MFFKKKHRNYDFENCETYDVKTEETKTAKRSVPVLCVQTGEYYESINQASIQTGISRRSISRSLQTGKSVKGCNFERKED